MKESKGDESQQSRLRDQIWMKIRWSNKDENNHFANEVHQIKELLSSNKRWRASTKGWVPSDSKSSRDARWNYEVQVQNHSQDSRTVLEKLKSSWWIRMVRNPQLWNRIVQIRRWTKPSMIQDSSFLKIMEDQKEYVRFILGDEESHSDGNHWSKVSSPREASSVWVMCFMLLISHIQEIIEPKGTQMNYPFNFRWLYII